MANDNPNAKTSMGQTRAILQYMREGHAITPGEARKMFGTDRLGARIMDIEKIVGYKPPRKMVKVVGKDVDGNPVVKHVKQYWLEPES